MESGLSKDDMGWGSPTFHRMGREKINLIRAFTSWGFTILVSDVDTVWYGPMCTTFSNFGHSSIGTLRVMEQGCVFKKAFGSDLFVDK